MKKKFFAAAAVALSSAFAFNVSAQDPCPENCTPAECAPASCDKAAACTKQGPAAACPFDKLNLSDDQKTKIKALSAERRKKAIEARKDKKETGMESRKAYLAKLKEILSPEQYIMFLENSYTDATGQHGRKLQAAGGRHGKLAKEAGKAKCGGNGNCDGKSKAKL